MLETHPFGSFVPPQGAKYLMLGSFTTKEANDTAKDYVWFYSNGRNHFWPIMREVYGLPRERVKNSNLDVNLVNIVYAIDDLTVIITSQPITKIFFTSRFVEGKFRRLFKDLIAKNPHIELVTLPSPSPRYAQLTRSQKVDKYRQLLPGLVQ